MSRQSSRADGWRLDLLLVAALAVLGVASQLVSGVPVPVEWAVGLPFLLVAPGWALIALVLPGSPQGSEGSPTRADDGPGWVVRLALTFPTSVLVVAAVAYVASATVGIRLVPVVAGVGAVTIVCLLGAWLRRRTLAPAHRASPLGARVGSSPSAFGTTLHRATFLLALVALVSAVALAGTTPASQDGYTEFYVLNENDDGDLVAADYGSADAGGTVSLSLAIENDEGQSTTYDVVARAVSTGSGSAAEQVDRFQTSVPDGERVIAQRTFPSRTVADGSRLQFLLYKDGVPADPSPENAALTLSVGGEEAGSTGGNGTDGRSTDGPGSDAAGGDATGSDPAGEDFGGTGATGGNVTGVGSDADGPTGVEEGE